MSKLSKISMFLSSYTPLYFFVITLNYSLYDVKLSILNIFKISVWTTSDIFLYVLLIVIIFPNIFLLIVIRLSRNYPETITITNIEDANDKILDYILAYIVSFISTDFANISNADSKVIHTAIWIQVLLGYLYCRGNMFYINPVLNLLGGFDIYSIETGNNTVILLSKNTETFESLKDQLMNNETIRQEFCFLCDNIYIDF